jgi:hypothetical protein
MKTFQRADTNERRCYTDRMLNPTPKDKLLDSQGRPYFLWDCDMTLEEFQRGLQHPIPTFAPTSWES